MASVPATRFDLSPGEGVCFACANEATIRYRYGLGVIDSCGLHSRAACREAHLINDSLGDPNPFILVGHASHI